DGVASDESGLLYTLHNSRVSARITQFSISVLKRRKKSFETLRSLKLSQIRGVRRRDVYSDVVSDWLYDVEACQIVLNGFFIRHVLVLSDIHANDAFSSEILQSFHYRFSSIVIEPKAVDKSLIVR